MLWVELSCVVSPAEIEAATAVLSQYGKGGVVIEERGFEVPDEKTITVKIYLTHSRCYQNIRREIEMALERVSSRINLKQRILKPGDWFDSVKLHFGVLEIGERFIIKPSWLCPIVPCSSRMIIELDPGAAFGTGLHPTTRLCIVKMEKHLLPGMSVLDMGTGSGILAIAAVKLRAKSVLALDTDPLAIRSALNNIEINRVESNIQVRKGTLSLKRQKEYREFFNLVLANISVSAVAKFAPAFMKVLKYYGVLIVSGISAAGIDESLIRLAMAGFKIENVDVDGEWYSVVASKPEK